MTRKALLFLALVVGSVSLTAAGSLRITDFLVDIEVHSTGVLSVTETLDVLYDTPYHGIYREIPVSYRRPTGENLTVDLSLLAITMNGGDVPHVAKRSGGALVIRVGDPDRTLVGAYTYTIGYEVSHALLFGNAEYVQLFWNATGNEWQIPIDHATARVRLPETVCGLDVPTTSYIGYSGSTARGQPALRDGEGRLVFEATDLAPGEGLTIDVSIPRGPSGIEPPGAGEVAVRFLRANVYALLPVLAFLVMLLWWWRRGKDPAKGVIAPRFDPPPDVRAGEAGVLMDDRVGLQDISAMVIDLAVKGFLGIREVSEEEAREDVGKTAGSSGTKDYVFTKLRDGDGKLTNVERLLLDGIFDKAHPKKRTLSSMENSFYKVLPAIEKGLYARLIKKGHYASDPEGVRTRYFGVAVVIGILGIALGLVLSSLYLGVAVGLCGLIVLAFSPIMPRKTRKGADALREILGLAEYIGLAEVRRLEFHDAPERDPHEFERLLPYAIALNLTKVWTRQFAGMLTVPPEWFAGSGDAFGEREFGRSMARLTRGMQRTFVTAPRTRRPSQGRSARRPRATFGRRSSGGGFGGGGGGGW